MGGQYRSMDSCGVRVAILGVAQDGGVPQAGCGCERCSAAQLDPSLRLHPSSIAILGEDGGLHLVEATRDVSQQLWIASTSLGMDGLQTPKSVCLTHAHLGHIDGLGQFGKESMGLDSVPLLASSKVLDAVCARGLEGPFETTVVESSLPFTPSKGCGFQYTLLPVPHRDEDSDTHAILISGPNKSLLFLPDHDNWGETLGLYGAKDVRSWLLELGVDIALIDGTFWDEDELPGRDMTQIPHPTVSETLERIGKREDGDPDVIFIHLNHTNPLVDESSDQTRRVGELGWGVAQQSTVLEL